ncbi:MmcQ/YjbR family DNA-binding protein [Salinarimonas ramus]|uniref:DNA-binding protein (MmcQ/YjbR family) n=1 Tax=Salinarimonas ramus TaxID=690164 RepID=A0A917QJL8_9HYPH|nr:MmcQ/YjbR family DNA-binding protein [Salinarimonas ramus]GGK53738.1 hypothetical protein GCM10011322_45660 [Salinarimonas ramus]
MSASFRQRVAAICERLPGVETTRVWGDSHEVWTVGGRIFAGIGTMTRGVAVKCADVETAQMLVEAGVGTPARYFHRSWLLLPEDAPEDEITHRIGLSYDLIRAKLPKAARAALPVREDA